MAEPRLKPQVQRSTTGVPGLDDILNGGLLSHRLYLIDGDPGAGKTTLALQFLLEGVRAGEKCLYITLSETKEELSAGAASHGWSLDGIEIVELIAEESDLDGESQVTMYHPSEVELTETTRRVLHAVEKTNASRIVFDSLSELRLLAQNSLRYRRQILALKQFFIGRKCTVLLLDDRTSEGSDLQLQSIAHGVVSLDQLSPIYGAERRRLRVMKLRGSSFRGGYHDFTIREGGIVVFPRLVASEHSEQFNRERIKSGVTALDALLGGGPDRGTSTLLMGPAGSGKSTIAVQYAVAAAERGDHAVIFAFDESLATLKARTEALGIQIQRGFSGRPSQSSASGPGRTFPGGVCWLGARVCGKGQCACSRNRQSQWLHECDAGGTVPYGATSRTANVSRSARCDNVNGCCSARHGRSTHAIAYRHELPRGLGGVTPLF